MMSAKGSVTVVNKVTAFQDPELHREGSGPITNHKHAPDGLTEEGKEWRT